MSWFSKFEGINVVVKEWRFDCSRINDDFSRRETEDLFVTFMKYQRVNGIRVPSNFAIVGTIRNNVTGTITPDMTISQIKEITRIYKDYGAYRCHDLIGVTTLSDCIYFLYSDEYDSDSMSKYFSSNNS